MWVEEIKIRNFRSIVKADIKDLPSKGIIAILGENESGKSALAEALVFVFYGRSVNSGSSVTDLIRWGSDRMRVEIGFSTDQGRFRLQREIDCLGAHVVTLCSLDQREEKEIGVHAVRKKLLEIGISDFKSFQNLFYLHSPLEEKSLRESLLEEICGIKILTRAASELKKEIKGREKEYSFLVRESERKVGMANKQREVLEELEESAAKVEKLCEEFSSNQEEIGKNKKLSKNYRLIAGQIQRVGKRLSSLSSEKLPRIKEEFQKAKEIVERNSKKISEITDSSKTRNILEEIQNFLQFLAECEEGFSTSEQKLHEKKEQVSEYTEQMVSVNSRKNMLHKKKFFSLWATLLGVAGVALAAWFLFSSENSVAIDTILKDSIGWLCFLGVSFVVCLLSFFLFVAFVFKSIKFQHELKAVSDKCKEVEKEVSDLESLFEEDRKILICWATIKDRIVGEKPFSIADPDSVVSFLSSEFEHLGKQFQDLAEEANKTQRFAQEKFQKTRSNRDRAENKLHDKHEAESRLKNLEFEIERLKTQACDLQKTIDTHLLALELLETTVSTIHLRTASVLNIPMRKLVAPFTGGSYREVRFSNSRDPEVFSPLKGDFLSLEELSGTAGTGVMLSLPIAMASVLARARYPGGHFILFDYNPFVYFDEKRKKMALEALGRFESFSQVFIFMKDLPDGVDAAVVFRLKNGAILPEIKKTMFEPLDLSIAEPGTLSENGHNVRDET